MAAAELMIADEDATVLFSSLLWTLLLQLFGSETIAEGTGFGVKRSSIASEDG